MKLGYLHFLDPDNSEKAVAAISGQPPVSIENIGELDTSTRYITNLETGLPGNSSPSNHALFFQNNYLRLSTDKILQMLHVDQEDPERQAEILAGIFSNVVTLGREMFEIPHLAPFEYRKGIRKMCFPVDEPVSPDVWKMVLDSTQFYTFCSAKTNPDKRIVFDLPKVAHGKKILQTMLPAGEWLAVKSLPLHSEEILSWLKEANRPFFAKVTLSDFDPEIQPLINFGSNVPEGSERQWVTNVELEMLAGKAEIVVKEVWKSSDVLTSNYVAEKVSRLPDVADLCFSLGLLVENIWSGWALKHSSSKQRKIANVVGPFLRAMDRKLCFEQALALHAKGFDIASYGLGKVIVDSSFHENKEIVKAALDLELLPPYCPGLSIDLTVNDSNFLKLQTFYATGKTDTILEFDERITGLILGRHHDVTH